MLEGGFLGLLLFGGTRLGPRLWLAATILVVVGAHFSAIWILMANSWMQTPQGYVIQPTQWGNLAFVDDFQQVLFTPSFLPRLLHTWVASWMVGAALVASVSAFYVLKNRHLDIARRLLPVAIWVFGVLALLQAVVFGANMAIEVTNQQPLKLASMEGLYQSESCARMFVVGWVDETTQTTSGISIPCLLSFLAYQDIHATVQGIDSFAPDPTPPINLVFQVYHFMITVGPALAAIGVLAGLMFLWRRRLFESRFVLWLLVLTVFMGEATITAGWWTAEVGRQPWVVYDVLRTVDGVSPVLSAVDVVTSLGMFVLLYSLLLVLFLYLLNKKIQDGPEELEEVETVALTSLPDTFRDVFSRRNRAADLGDSRESQ
jgi:cytochrome d ubiquinol oxidase subunit I